MFSGRAIFLWIFLFVLTIQSGSGAGKFRRWTDDQGRKVEARMTGFARGMVLLELRDGRTTKVPIDKLRARDQAIARKNAKLWDLAPPVNVATASGDIDKMLWEGLAKANADIKRQIAELAKDTRLNAEEKKNEAERLEHMRLMTHPTGKLDDQLFMRRAYLDIAGRIPTYDETRQFLRNSSSSKRNDLIDELIDSEAFVSHFFNYLGDLLRIRDGISMGGFDNLKAGAYADWVKDQIRNDLRWDKFVSDLLSAEGQYWDNPATGYLLTDFGMELCNLSNTFTTFTGTEITCAQCHNHPFEDVYQIDFYRMAAFFGNLEFEARPSRTDLQIINTKLKEFSAEAKKAKQNINDLTSLFSAYRINLGDGPNSKVELPFDYQYDNGEPYQKIKPGVYFGDNINVASYRGPRHAFAEWMTAESNPRFTINIANRLWKHVFGIAQIEPVDNIPGHLDGQAQNYELLKFLEQLMKEVDYSIKDFLRVLYKTDTYQREACHKSPTLAMIDRGEFHFPAPILRRMTAEQLWDSLVAMSVAKPEASEYQTRILEQYREIMNTSWASMDLKGARELKKKYDSIGKSGMMASNNRRNRRPAMRMVRASELPMPERVGSFLYSFGQSDKKFIENGNRDGTIPQVMELLNGSLTNQFMAADDKEMVRIARSRTSRSDGAQVIFLSILSRYPHPQERELAEKLIRGGGKGKSTDYSDLIWALLNTREFMFIQ